jgi:hypothetical protein
LICPEITEKDEIERETNSKKSKNAFKISNANSQRKKTNKNGKDTNNFFSQNKGLQKNRIKFFTQ